MTIIEQKFMEKVPILLELIAVELNAINETLKLIAEQENGTES